MTSHPIPARGETTPNECNCGAGWEAWVHTQSCPAYYSFGYLNPAPASSLPVEPAGTPEGYGVVTTIGGGALLVDREDEHAPVARFVSLAEGERFIAWLAALTSEVSALREAVDRAKATDLGYTTKGQQQEPGPVIQPTVCECDLCRANRTLALARCCPSGRAHGFNCICGATFYGNVARGT